MHVQATRPLLSIFPGSDSAGADFLQVRAAIPDIHAVIDRAVARRTGKPVRPLEDDQHTGIAEANHSGWQDCLVAATTAKPLHAMADVVITGSA
jgi:hypothetical protein